MTRNFKALGLALVAMFAITAVFSSAASAQFESEAESTTLSVSGNAMQSFKTSAGSETTVECTTVQVDGTVASKATTTVRVTPTYSSCEKFLGIAVEIDENGCHYDFNLADNATSGSVNLECPSATGIEITVGNTCRYEIDSQSSLGTITYANKGTSSTREVELQPNVTGITSTRTTSDFPFLCPNGSATGTYTGNSTVTGKVGANHVGVFVD